MQGTPIYVLMPVESKPLLLEYLPLILSLVSIVSSALIAFYALRQGKRLANENYSKSIRPMLVFIKVATGGWAIKNFGQGPALNMEIGHCKATGEWNVVRCYPFAVGQALHLGWVEPSALQLRARYRDINNDPLYSTSSVTESTFGTGDPFKSEWKAIKRQKEEEVQFPPSRTTAF